MSGSGIIEAEVFRSEQVSRLARTSDPSSPSRGDAWIRTDVQPVTDSVAALRVQGDSGYLEAPLFDPSVSLGEDVYVGQRFVFDDGSEGHLLVTDQGGAVGSPRVVTSAGTAYEAHDATEVNVIPDSGIFRYDFEDDSDASTATDAFAGDGHTAHDGSITGATFTSTSRWGNFGLSSDGVDDSLTTPLTYGDLPSPYSYGVWVYPNETPPWSQNMHLLKSGWALNFRLPSGRSDVELKTFSFEGGSSNSVYSSVNLSGNSWNFVGFSLTSDTGTLVVDGSVDNSGTGYHSSENNSLDVTDDLNGVLDRPTAYSKELTSTEWSNLYNTGSING